MFFYDNELRDRNVSYSSNSMKNSALNSVPKNAIQAAIEESLSFDCPPDAMISILGRSYLYFAGNGYLGLQADPEVLAATCEAVLRYGVGTATSRAAFTSPPVFEVERRIAEILGTERSLYTVSGYIANQILLESLEGTFDRIFIDESSHYSLFNAAKRIRGVRCRPIAFRHRNINDLKEKLDANLQLHEKPIVITDGVFSYLGTIAPIRDYVDLLADYEGASLWIDDAHSFGVLGENGYGTLEHFGFDSSVVNRTVQDDADHFGFGNCSTISTRLFTCFSLSKAVGGCGGVIPGSESFIQRLKDRSSFFFGASAPASPIAAATAKALSILTENTIRQKLRENTVLLKNRLRNLGMEINDLPVPIVILTLGSSGNMRRIQKELSEKGILISYLPRYVGLGSTGALRIAVFATHTSEMINELVDSLKKII
ncbi:MAG: pyridoxal phosphate-dependent aminotransferase family protein [Planctomycetaceae bacterium]|jgi:7-keto-8-aminopelargonate synthetase-like enzyme|nr:pyridoxal phosphate-dependent aminotransferase family protein [Planctomycetaceae bacterium]